MISPLTAIHFTWPPEQPEITSRTIIIFIKILYLTCNWSIYLKRFLLNRILKCKLKDMVPLNVGVNIYLDI